MGGQQLGQAVRVLARLGLDPGEGVPLGLGLHDPEGLAVGVEQVVGGAGLQGELADGHADGGVEVHVGVVLHRPAGLGEQLVDALAGLLLGRHGRSLRWGFAPPE